MAAIERIPYREMENYPMVKSYEGILRISNILDASQDEDYFFNPDLYGSHLSTECKEESGYNDSHDALLGAIERYSYPNDLYKDQKIPLTDSAGNFMNIYVGENSLTFGSDELNNGNNSDKATYTQVLYNKQFTQTKIFPILTSDWCYIGLEKRLLPERKKTVVGGTITIENSPYEEGIDAMLIVNNNFDHTPSNINGTTYKNLHEVDKTHTYRTIYRDTNPKLGSMDILVHHQDEIDMDNYTKNGVIDSFVDVMDLQSYIKEQVTKYIKSGTNVIGVPSGTVIWEHISLAKWYGIGQTFTGNNPPMGRHAERRVKIYNKGTIDGASETNILAWQWDKSLLPEGTYRLKKVTIHCSETLANNATKAPLYLGVWDRDDGIKKARKIGTSTNTQTPQNDTELVFEFNDNVVFSSNRDIRFIPLTNRDDMWAQHPTNILSLKTNDDSTSHSYLWDSGEKQLPKLVVGTIECLLLSILPEEQPTHYEHPITIFDPIQDTNEYTPSLYQGTVRKGLNSLAAISDEQETLAQDTVETGDGEDEYYTKQLKEAIPLYKRDYTLCDGSTFTIFMVLPEMANDYNYTSYNQFINLFFTIGYQYTDLSVIRPHYANHKEGNVYKWTYIPEKGYKVISVACDDRDVLFGIDLLQMLAIKAIYNNLKSGAKDCLDDAGLHYDRAKAETWLKTASLPREYIFNTMIPPEEGGMTYAYTTSNTKTPQTYNFPIGREVNSFGSLIRYYDTDAKKYVNVPAWSTAELQDVLDFFTQDAHQKEHTLKAYYYFPFQVPNFIAGKEGGENEYEVGTFVGYSPLTWASDWMWLNNIPGECHVNYLYFPHRHAIAMGPTEFYPNNSSDFVKSSTGTWPYPYVKTSTGPASDDAMIRSEGMVRWKHYWDDSFWSAKLCGTDFGLEHGSLGMTKEGSENTNAYTLAEVSGLDYITTIRNGIPIQTIEWIGHTSIDDPDPRWQTAEPNRGITSEPINTIKPNYKNQSASANTAEGEVKIFTPEYIQMVPLIKL